MNRITISMAAAALAAGVCGAAQADCSVSSSVTTGPGGTSVAGTPGKTVTVYDSEGRAIGVIARSDECGATVETSRDGSSTTVRSGDGSTAVTTGAGGAAGSSAGSSSVTTGSGGGSSTTSQGGLSSSVTVGPGGVSGETRIK